MSQLDHALLRLNGAIGRLEAAIGDGRRDDAEADDAGLRAERDRLVDEIERLRARADEDARLRAEAAEAVRDALRDLRGAIGQGAGAAGGGAAGGVYGNA